jgi:hypothetical protein
MNDLVPRKTLVKQGGLAIGGVGGGIALLLLSGLGGIPALIVGGIVTVVGLAISGSKDDRTAGTITAGAGILTAAHALPFLGGLAGTLMSISGIGLLVMGGINLFKFIRNYRNRM